MLHRLTVLVCLLARLLPITSAATVVPDYRLGDVVTQDVITPVRLAVVNPEATEALRQRVAQEVHFIVQHTPSAAAEAESELRASVAETRARFMQMLRRELRGRRPQPADLDTPAFERALRTLAGELTMDFPLEKLARLWLRDVSDEAYLPTLLEPLRGVMARPVIDSGVDAIMPPNRPIRLVPVATESEAAAGSGLESGGIVVSADEVLSHSRARQLVEDNFAANQQDIGRFVASFVRINAHPDRALTDRARMRQTEGIVVHDTYERGDVIVREGQSIDRKALRALLTLDEQRATHALQTQLQPKVTSLGVPATWIGGAVVGVSCVLVLVLWRRRCQQTNALVPHRASALAPPTRGHGLSSDSDWKQRALAAERQAARAHEAIRAGALAWMRERVFRTLFRHRAELLHAQQKAIVELRELEQRLAQLQIPLQDRLAAYERRIQELERELAAKGAENRELLGAGIKLAQHQLNVERDRGRLGMN